jgi:hypothetical protein
MVTDWSFPKSPINPKDTLAESSQQDSPFASLTTTQFYAGAWSASIMVDAIGHFTL